MYYVAQEKTGMKGTNMTMNCQKGWGCYLHISVEVGVPDDLPGCGIVH